MTMPTGSFSFTKEPRLIDPIMTKLRFGMAWDATGGGRNGWAGKLQRKRGADLDLLVVASEGADAKRLCWFDHLDPFNNGSLVHHGDNTTGRGDGDEMTNVAVSGNLGNDQGSFVNLARRYARR